MTVKSVCFLLGFLSGLPFALLGSTLMLYLTQEGLSVTLVALFSVIGLPYSLKFLWANVVDRYHVPFLSFKGKRISWLILCQLVLVIGLLVLSFLEPRAHLILFMWVAVFAAFASATQDIVIDAYRTEITSQDQRPAIAAIAVFGYRAGLLVSGVGAIYLSLFTSWQMVYQMMAAIMAVGCVLCFLFLKEREKKPFHADAESPNILQEKPSLFAALAAFCQHHKEWKLILLFVLTYRLPDLFIAPLAMPFYVHLGFSAADIATFAKFGGLIASLAGAALCSLCVYRFGLKAMLIALAVGQVLSNFLFLALMEFPTKTMLAVIIACDSFVGGLAATLTVILLTSLSFIPYTATHYALLTALTTALGTVLGLGSGVITETFSWQALFLLSGLFVLPSLGILWQLKKKNHTLLIFR